MINITYKKLLKNKDIEVYSIQQDHIIELLEKTEIFVPKLNESAAYDLENSEPIRNAHKVAYGWMANQFEKNI